MSRLYFECNFKSSKLRSLDLPVEIRKPSLALVARSLLSQPVELEPGIYYVIAKLPAGQELYNRIQVVEGADATVVLTPEPEDTPLHEWQEVDYYLGGAQPTSPFQNSPLESLDSGEAGARLRAFIGNVLLGNYGAIDTSNWNRSIRTSEGVAQLYIDGVNDVQLVQLLQPEKPAINVFLPAGKRSRCLIVLARLPNGQCSVNVHLENVTADLLLRFLERGLLEQASITATSRSLDAEQLLLHKKQDPVAAAVGAYALLRLSTLDQLHDWTENLKNWFTWLPDGIAIRGEHLARLGEHAQALNVLLELPSRGLPLFTDGLSYAIDRLRLYISLGDSHFEKAKLSQAENLLEQLQQFATFIDFSKPTLTFTGIEPDTPSNELLNEDIKVYGGLDLSEYMGVAKPQSQQLFTQQAERITGNWKQTEQRNFDKEQTSNVQVTIAIKDPELEDNEREEIIQILFNQMRQISELEKVERVRDLNPPVGIMSSGGFLIGMLTAEVKGKNIKALMQFIGERLLGRTIEVEFEFNGQKLVVEASNQRELLAAIQAAEQFVEGR